MNARLDTIQAAILNTKLKYFEETIKNRNACANYYTQQLQYLEKIGFELPKVNKNFTSVWAQYSILAPNIEIRDNIVNYLKEKNINVSIFYPSPLHLQECFNYLGYKIGDLPVTESVCDRIFNLPCYGELTNKEQVFIIDMLRQFNVKAI